MRVQLLNSFSGDDIREIDTATAEGRGTAAKLIADLLKSGSALFLEKEVNGETYTYRVSGYDAERDKIKLTLATNDKAPEGFTHEPRKRGRGPGKIRNRSYIAAPHDGTIVSVAPVSGGSGSKDRKRRRRAARVIQKAEVEGNPLTWGGIRYGIQRISEMRGWHHGCPMPSTTSPNHQLAIARGAPLADVLGTEQPTSFNATGVRVCKHSDVNEDPERQVNQWIQEPVQVQVWRDSKGPFRLRMPMGHVRLRFWLDTIAVRAGAVDSDTEFVAMQSLFEKITEQQRDSYILSGAFFEKSHRSGVTYVLRKGLPTIALRVTEIGEDQEQRHFLAALCLHPMAYYHQTWAGSQPPTDEVIAHLLLIRADEHRLWKKSGQHPINDPRAAI